MHVVMFFQEVPEHTKIFIFNEENENYELAKLAHGCYINHSDEETYPAEVRNFLIDLSADLETPVFSSRRPLEREPVKIPDGIAVVCGFIL